MKLSLQQRLLYAALFILLIFAGLTGLALDKAFRESAETALQDRLNGYMFALLAATEVSENGRLSFSRNLPDARFQRPASGLYAQVLRTDNQSGLKSKSNLGINLVMPVPPATGKGRFQRLSLQQGEILYSYSFTAKWEFNERQQYPVSYLVAENMHSYHRQITQYRKNLWGWLGLATFLLLLAQGSILRWGLKPLRQVEQELAEIESGAREQLQENYPRELNGLTCNLNALLGRARNQLVRYRDALGNVSHSLKTPLTVLRSAINNREDEQHFNRVANEQLERMQQIIDYHLQRAATVGRRELSKPVAIKPIAEKIIRMLKKSHAEREIQVKLDMDELFLFFGDEGDLYEILGNLFDNAFKWARRRIRISASHGLDKTTTLLVEDDGPGIPAQLADEILQRGKRADTNVEGQGIGMAMVHETVLLYGGSLEITASELGGAAMQIHLPDTPG